MKTNRTLLIIPVLLLLVGCVSTETQVQQRVEMTVQALSIEWTQQAADALLTATAQTPDPLQAEGTLQADSTPIPLLGPNEWKSLPVLPTTLSSRMRQVYALGQLAGNNPQAFSKVGDCHSTLPGFLGGFDTGRYDLGQYSYLQATIDYFQGSFDRQSRAVKDGLTANAALVALWNDWRDCYAYETPLECEYRQQNPAFAIISFGTNDVMGFADFEITLRRVINTTLGHNIVPILVTKADNAEGDYSANLTIAALAAEYEIPLWNFWAAVQDLPDNGMNTPQHLSESEYLPTTDLTSAGLKYGQNMRNLNALQVLDIIRRLINNEPLPDALAQSVTPTPTSTPAP